MRNALGPAASNTRAEDRSCRLAATLCQRCWANQLASISPRDPWLPALPIADATALLGLERHWGCMGFTSRTMPTVPELRRCRGCVQRVSRGSAAMSTSLPSSAQSVMSSRLIKRGTTRISRGSVLMRHGAASALHCDPQAFRSDRCGRPPTHNGTCECLRRPRVVPAMSAGRCGISATGCGLG